MKEKLISQQQNRLGGRAWRLPPAPGSFQLLVPLSATMYATSPAGVQPVTRGKGGRGEEAVFFQGNSVEMGRMGHTSTT